MSSASEIVSSPLCISSSSLEVLCISEYVSVSNTNGSNTESLSSSNADGGSNIDSSSDTGCMSSTDYISVGDEAVVVEPEGILDKTLRCEISVQLLGLDCTLLKAST